MTETDGLDATYFIVYQLEVIQRAVEQLHDCLRQKIEDVRDVEQLLKGSDQFNHRQFALLGKALRDPDATFTFQTPAASHGVTHETARADLLPARGYGIPQPTAPGTALRLHGPCGFAPSPRGDPLAAAGCAASSSELWRVSAQSLGLAPVQSTATGASASSWAHVAASTTPLGAIPCALWKDSTSASVCEPKMPVVS